MVSLPSIPGDQARAGARRAAEVLSRDPRIRLVFLFGSAADEERERVGDIDLAIWTQPPMSLRESLILHGDVEEAADARVDLVLLHEASVVLAREVSETGICLYEAEEGLETEWRVRAIMEYLDFKPYLERTRRYLRETREELLRDAPA